MRSFKARLNIGVIIFSLLFFSALIITNIIFFNSFGERFISARLAHDTDALLAALKPGKAGRLELDIYNMNPIFLQPLSGHYFRVELEDADYRSESLWDKTIPLKRLPMGQSELERVKGPKGQVLLVRTGGYRKEGQKIWISVAEDYSPITKPLHQLMMTLAILNGFIILVLIFFQRVMVDRGLKPLKQITEDLTRLGRGETLFLNEKVPEEVLPLVKEINQLLVMVDSRVKRSVTALGNLAHAIKTPLALIEQVITSDSQIHGKEGSEEIKQAVYDIKHWLNSELRRARIIGTPAHGQKHPVAELIGPLVATLQRIYEGRQLDFQLDIDDRAEFLGDRHDLMELFGNLLDNACKWARSKIVIQVKSQQGGIAVVIEDDGPGVTLEMFEMLEKRGTRLDESGEGHGLGLSIVREIVTLYDADLAFEPSEQYGGLRVSVNLGKAT